MSDSPKLALVDVDALLSGLQGLVERSTRAAPAAVAAEPEPWLTVADAAAYAAVSEDTIREWIRLESLPCGRAGRVIRLRRSAIDALLLDGDTAPRDLNPPEIPDSLPRRKPATRDDVVSERAAEILRSLRRGN